MIAKRFSLDKRWFWCPKAENLSAFGLHWTHGSRERSSPFENVEHGQQGKGPVGILGEAAIAHLGKAPETLEHEERMFDLGAHTGLAPVRRFVGLGQRPVFVGSLVGKVFGLGGQFPEPFPLFLAPVGAVAVEPGLLPMQQIWHFMAVMDIGRKVGGMIEEQLKEAVDSPEFAQMIIQQEGALSQRSLPLDPEAPKAV